MINAAEVKRVVEAALLSAAEPLRVADLRRLFPADWAVDSAVLAMALGALNLDWAGRGIELVEVAGGWRFQTTAEMAAFLERLHPERPPRYSRAVLETLAIIAYRQPVTRGEIEAIRGVTVASAIIKTLEERGWIETVGFKDVLGRPALWATTARFLDDLNLASLQDLPALADGLGIEAADPEVPGMVMPEPASLPGPPVPNEPPFVTFSDGRPEL